MGTCVFQRGTYLTPMSLQMEIYTRQASPCAAVLAVCLRFILAGAHAQTSIINFNATADTTLERPSARHGRLMWNMVGAHTGYPLKRTLIRYNTPTVVSGQRIVCARAEMFFHYAHRASSQPDEPWVDRNITVGAMLLPWNETEATSIMSDARTRWPTNYLNNPNVVQQSTETVHKVCQGNTSHWSGWEITEIAREWSNGSMTNNGLIVWATNERVLGRDIRFRSRNYRHTQPYNHPVLRVAYARDDGSTSNDCSMFEDLSNECQSSGPAPSPTTLSPTTLAPIGPPTIAQMPATADTTLEAANIRHGSLEYNIVGAHTDWPLKRTLLAFETPQVRNGMSIVCARVEMYFVYAHRASSQISTEPWVDRNITIGAMRIPWNEMRATSATNGLNVRFPQDLPTNSVFVAPESETSHLICEGNRSHWAAWEVTEIVRDWAFGDEDNNGVILWATNEQINGRDIRFASREAADVGRRPVLQVAYARGNTQETDCSMFDNFNNVCEAEGPSFMPTSLSPSSVPSATPTLQPSRASSSPTAAPRVSPTSQPSSMPSVSPTTLSPTPQIPTRTPSLIPSTSSPSTTLITVDESTGDSDSFSSSTTMIVIVIVVIVILVALIAILFILISRKKKKSEGAMPAFENPAYNMAEPAPADYAATDDLNQTGGYMTVSSAVGASGYMDVAPEEDV